MSSSSRCRSSPTRPPARADRGRGGLLLRRRRALLPGRRGPDQQPAAARPRRADPPARLRPDRRAARADRARGGDHPGARRHAAVAAEDRRPPGAPGGGGRRSRHRHGRDAIARAADRVGPDGRLVGFADSNDRWVPEWGELLGLGPVRRGTYVSSAALAIGARSRPSSSACSPSTRGRSSSSARSGARTSPATRSPSPTRTCSTRSWPRATRTRSRCSTRTSRRLRRSPACGCATRARSLLLRGRDEAVPRPPSRRPPWLEPTEHGVYSRLLRRLLVRDDVAIRVDPSALPAGLRTGAEGGAKRVSHDVRARLRNGRGRDHRRMAETGETGPRRSRERRSIASAEARYFLGAVGLVN